MVGPGKTEGDGHYLTVAGCEEVHVVQVGGWLVLVVVRVLNSYNFLFFISYFLYIFLSCVIFYIIAKANMAWLSSQINPKHSLNSNAKLAYQIPPDSFTRNLLRGRF